MSELKVHASVCEIERMVQSEEVRRAFVKRLKEALAQSGIAEWGAGARLAEITGKTAKAASKWLNAESMPGRANMLAIAQELKVRAEWLQYEEGPMRATGAMVAQSSAATALGSDDHKDKEGNVTAVDFSRKRVKRGFVDIQQLNVMASMGHGAVRPEFDEVIDHMTVSLDFLSQQVRFSRAENLALITAYGDSMAVTFNDGDVLLVDRGITEVKIDAVYVLALKDELYIKRIQRCGDGTFLMISDNEKYKPIEVTEKDMDRFQVLARVLMAWNAKKL